MTRRQMLLATTALCAPLLVPESGWAQAKEVAATPGAAAIVPNLAGQTGRPLRYRPQGEDFVIEDGAEFFNRPLYGGNTAFRVDGGDKPEFVLYLPGRGGNLRLAVRTGGKSLWLHAARRIVTRYRPGELHYELRDPIMGDGLIRISTLAWRQTEGLILRVTGENLPHGIELVWVYGGVNGERGARDGDIGTERVPISEYFQFKPEFAQDNKVQAGDGGMRLTSAAAVIAGVASAGARWHVADAADWNDVAALCDGRQGPGPPVAVGRALLLEGKTVFVSLQRLGGELAAASDLGIYQEVSHPLGAKAAASTRLPGVYAKEILPALFDETARQFARLRSRVRVKTPDPYIDLAMDALNIAADALWDDPQQALMHGAIAWRTKLLGWRGPYVLDALGHHDRARLNFDAWLDKQNREPIPPALPPADAGTNLSRNEAGLHSNGDLSNSHYDMNLVFIDALLRHLLWTGDKGYARRAWPVIERHLAWERRLFRREFGPQKLPLYEAYAAIWASDDIQYGGGGVSHASAYNLFHNRMAARLARLLSHDPAPYEREAALIAEAMQTLLWLPEKGAYGEYKDYLGDQRVHAGIGLWSFYHCTDSGALSPRQAWSMAQSLQRDFAPIPVHGPGVPSDAPYHVLPTTNWMPYTWSANNVVMAENLHTALGLWQAGRATDAFVLMKGALLASMYMGISPGNVGTMNYLDVYRREAQRDFADGAGVMSRAVIEGLFGVAPDALEGVLRVNPGFPQDWRQASLSHPDLEIDFSRAGSADRWRIAQHGVRFSRLILRVPAFSPAVRRVRVNGHAAAWRSDPEAVGGPILEIACPFVAEANITLEWGDEMAPAASAMEESAGFTRMRQGAFSWWAPAVSPRPAAPQTSAAGWHSSPVSGALACVDMSAHFNDQVTNIFQPGKYRAPRSPFVSLALPAQGLGAWAGHVGASARIDDRGLREAAANGGKFIMPGGVPFATPGPGQAPNILFVSQWDNYPREAAVALSGRASRAFLMMAGSTNHMQSDFDNGEVLIHYTDGGADRLALRNPTSWWPIDQDYFIDDFQFRLSGPVPARVDLMSGRVRLLNPDTFKGQGGPVPGGAANAFELALDPTRSLDRLTVRALANDVVIGLMAITLVPA